MSNIQTAVRLLRLVTEAEIEADKSVQRIEFLRQEVERFVWMDQSTNPNFNLSVKELDLSNAATALIPKGADTIGQLCQHSMASLCQSPKDKKIVREIQDSLRALGLVLKPRE